MPVNLLLIEDNPADAALLQGVLNDYHPGGYAIVVAPTSADAKSHLAQREFDAIVLDLSLPDSRGTETIGRVSEMAPTVPIVVLTGVTDKAAALEAVHLGAQDYLLKGKTDGDTLARAISYAMDRKQAEASLRAHRQELEAKNLELAAKNRELREYQRRLEAYRDRYIDLYDFAPSGYVTLDEDGYVQEINLAGAALLGADRDALIGYAFSDHVAAADHQAFAAHVQQCVSQRRETTSDVSLIALGGRTIPVQLRSVPVSEPETGGVLCKTAITDLTSHRNMEEALRESQAFLQTVIDAMPDMMMVVDRDFRVVQANKAAQAALGGDPASRCLLCYQVVSPDQARPCEGPNQVCPLKQVMATKSPIAVTHAHLGGDGRDVFLDVSASPVVDQAGEVTHVIEVRRDVTERKRLEAALRLTQLAVDLAADVIFWADQDARIVYANDEASARLGYSRDELLAMTVCDLLPDGSADGWRQHWDALTREGRLTFDLVYRAKDGGPVRAEVNVSRVEFQGKPYYCAVARPISNERKAAAPPPTA